MQRPACFCTYTHSYIGNTSLHSDWCCPLQGPPHPSPQRFHQHSRGHDHAPLHAKSAQADAATEPSKPTKAYNPRHPERTLLYRRIAEHFDIWFELTSAGQFDGQGNHHTSASYVEKAFRKYLECGIFAHGFARWRCDDCGDDFLVASPAKAAASAPRATPAAWPRRLRT